jgi:hypothetical protein
VSDQRLVRDITDTAARTWLLDAELGASWDGIRDRLMAALREAKAEGEQHVRSLPPTPHPVPSPWTGVDKRWLDDQAARLASVIIQQRSASSMPPDALDIAKEWVALFMQGLLDQRVKAERRRTEFPKDER